MQNFIEKLPKMIKNIFHVFLKICKIYPIEQIESGNSIFILLYICEYQKTIKTIRKKCFPDSWAWAYMVLKTPTVNSGFLKKLGKSNSCDLGFKYGPPEFLAGSNLISWTWRLYSGVEIYLKS